MTQLQKEKRQIGISANLAHWIKRQRRRRERHQQNRACRDNSRALPCLPMPYLA